MNFQRTILIFLWVLCAKSLWAQTQTLQLKDAIASACENNKQVVLVNNDEQIATAKYKQTDAIFLPQVGVSYTALTTNNPLNAFGFKLQQQSIAQSDFQPDLLNHPGNTSNFSAQAMLQQPIFNPDLLYQRKAAKMQIEISGLQKARTQDFIKWQTQNEFMQLQLAYEVVKVLEEALTTTKAIYKFTNDRYQQGYLQKSDLLNVDVRIKSIETQLASARSAIQNHSDNLSLLMGKPAGTIYMVDSLQALLLPAEISLPENRSDFQAMSKASSSYDLMMKSTKMSALPKLNGFASYQLNDANAFGFHSGSYLAGLQLTWNIFQGNKVHSTINEQKLQQRKINTELLQMKDKNQNELNAAQRNLSDAAYQIMQTKASVQQAQEVLNILQNRYKQGLAGITDVLLAQSQLSQQQLAYQQAILMQNVAVVYIQFLTADN
ncbi:hypothetical protein A9P82_07705 [Arachidicoccus ginsenosidimutans]|uniref:TolC family protein n=1 Tax=Arachidicoccus sp. BS20 TaxID=1850526 RepID=UPI0007F09D70|nr:TolC family protein [Arachidicoccus sp. BS20]ANI89186.1 hypothetical protein A9P82_07705 [Arachidicoccus sp. BS20]